MGAEVRVEGLTKQFGSQLIWNDVTLTLPAGEISVMLGPSGTGKSVFLKTLIGLIKPEKGHIWIEGVDIANCSEKDLYEIRKLFGVLFQDGAMFGSMDLYDNHDDAKSVMTAKFAKTYDEQTAPNLDELAPQRKINLEAVARSAGPVPCGSDCSANKASVLVFVDTDRRVEGQGTGEIFGNRLVVDLVRNDAGDWKIDNITDI